MQFFNLSRAESNQFTDVVISGRVGRIGQNKSDVKKVVPRFLRVLEVGIASRCYSHKADMKSSLDRGIISPIICAWLGKDGDTLPWFLDFC